MTSNSVTVQDVFRYFGNKKTNKKFDWDILLPYIIVPILLLISCISQTLTIIVMVAIGMGVSYVYSRPHQKNRSQFFYSWTLSSGLYMFFVFEFEILPFLEITQLENFILIVLMSCTFYSFYRVRSIADYELASSKGKEYSPVLTSDSYYCYICQIEVNERFFHSLWWDCCIFRPNYPYFLAGLLFGLFTLLFGSNMGLTTICRPYIFYGSLLLPEDCSDVYFEFDLAISFVTCVYALGYAVFVALALIQQLLIYIPRYSEPQWRRLVNVFNV